MVERFQHPRARSDHRAGGQVHAAPRRLPLRRRGACSTAASPTAPGCTSSGFRPTTSPARTQTWTTSSADVQGILVPGGFGNRGIEGKMLAARYAREHGVPYLGICLGMQIAVIEFARHVCGMAGANSTEFDPDTPYPGHRPHGGPEGPGTDRRHHAPGRVPLPPRAGQPIRVRSMAQTRSSSATATATSSTTPIPRPFAGRTACASAGVNPRARIWWRRWS